MKLNMFTLTALSVLAPAVLMSQTPPANPAGHEQHHPGASPAPAASPAAKTDMMARCKEMMARHQKMMEEMRAMDGRLDQLVSAMNAARGEDERLQAVMAVVNELVAQRRQMRDRMAAMQQMMMGHAMDHMSAGGGGMKCPMMKGESPQP